MLQRLIVALIVTKFTDEQYTTISQSTAGRFDPRVFVNCLQVNHDILQVSLTTAISDSLNREVFLAGVALSHTFHGLVAGTEYTISVTAATDAGLGQEAAITATTPQSLGAVISAPGMLAHYTLCCTVYVSH